MLGKWLYTNLSMFMRNLLNFVYKIFMITYLYLYIYNLNLFEK